MDSRKVRTNDVGGNMKTLTLILTLILAQQVSASSCFDSVEIKALIEASERLDQCFKAGNNCNFENRSIEEQKARNARRLIPVDRSKNALLNEATGVVTADLNGVDEKGNPRFYRASAQKISSCHIITSAHLIYKDGVVPVESNEFKLNFFSGQTCNQKSPFEKASSGKVVFKMIDESRNDFTCAEFDKYGQCKRRHFDAHSDLVIIKLDKYDKSNRNFFTLNTKNPAAHVNKTHVNCWGYPGYNNNLKIGSEKSNMFLWYQKDAQIFSGKDYQSDRGFPTNAITYKGMSGGGCSTSQNPNELVGLFANDNSVQGHSAIAIDTEKVIEQGANFLSGFHKLAARYSEENGGKSIADLDKECE